MRAFGKDILRTIGKSKKRFFAIMIITILGVSMFSGLKASCVDLRHSADLFFDDQNLFDLSVASTLGLTEEDVDALAAIDGVAQAEGIYSETVTAVLNDHTVNISLQTLSPTGLNEPYLVEGSLPVHPDEAAVTQDYVRDTGASVGDLISIEEELDPGDEDTDPEKPTFTVTEFKITAIVTDVRAVDATDGTMSWRSSRVSDDVVYILPEAVDTDIYTAIYLLLDGTKEMFCYGEAYENTVQGIRDLIEDEIKTQREEARYTEVKNDALEELTDAEEEVNEELSDAYQELMDGEQEYADELADARKKLTDAEKELADGKQELEEGEQELEDKEAQADASFAEAWQTISEKEQELAAGLAQSEQGALQLSSGEQQLAQAKAELTAKEGEANEQFAANRADLEARLAETQATQQSLQGQKESIAALLGSFWPTEEWDALVAAAGTDGQDAAAADLQTALDALPEEIKSAAGDSLAALPQLAVGLGLANSGIAQLEAGLAQLSSEEESAMAQIQAGWQEISQQEETLNQSRSDLEAGIAQLQAGLVQLEEGIAELKAQEESAYLQIEAGKTTIEENRQKLSDGEQELADGWVEYEDGAREGREELDEGWEEYEDGKTEAEEKFADARSEIEKIDMATWYVQDRMSLNGYSNIKSDADSIETIGTVFPIIFLIVAVLISLTTVTRMIEEDRSAIGTYKALGFTDREVQRKYMVYAFSSSLAGSIIGTIGAFIILPSVIAWIFSTMYKVPHYILMFVPTEGILGPLLFVGGVVLATALTCHKELNQVPASLLRPKSPRAGSRIILERIPFIWKRLSFLNKVTARNLFRYKKRMIMTIAGIAGCTALLLFGFAIRDSVHDLMPEQYEDIAAYDVMAVVSADDNDLLLSYIKDETENDKAESGGRVRDFINCEITTGDLSVSDEESVSVQLMIVPDGEELSSYIHMFDLDGNEIALEDGNVFITRNAGSVLGFSSGDTVSLKRSDLKTAELPVTELVENYLGNYVYMTEATFEEYYDSYAPNGLLIHLSEACTDPKAFTDELSGREGILSCLSTETLKEDFSGAFGLINVVVYIVILMSAALAFVVLFTLSTTNISERERELATIKVLGFFNPEVHLYVDKETMILTCIGILIGMPIGYMLAQTLTWLLNLPSIYLAARLHAVSYLIAAALALLFALIVNLLMGRTLDRIDPVEALKSVE